MHANSSPSASRRDFLKHTGRVAAVSALATTVVPHVHAAENNTIQLALIGCGGRGTGAAANAFTAVGGPVKLVAMADVFADRLKRSYEELKKQFAAKMDVPADRKFVDFEGYKKAMDCLKPGDVAIFATPPAFRWVHFDYAVKKGINIFMEKPLTVDGPSTRKFLSVAEASLKTKMKVGVGLMCRHCHAHAEVLKRIQGGDIGEIVALRAYRMHGPLGSCTSGPKPKDSSELMYQIRRFHSFLWASGGSFSDFYIHNIDECCWMKGAWPTEARASGGRHYRGDKVDQNFDNYSVEYTFPDDTRLFLYGRTMDGCYPEFSSYAQGVKGLAVLSDGNSTPAKSRIYKGQHLKKENLIWRYPQPEADAYVLEWNDLLDAIRNDKPYNEATRGAEASLVTAMGRMAAHTGQIVTRDEMLACEHEFAPDVDKLTFKSAAPLVAGADGKYPVPMPGLNKSREY